MAECCDKAGTMMMTNLFWRGDFVNRFSRDTGWWNHLFAAFTMLGLTTKVLLFAPILLAATGSGFFVSSPALRPVPASLTSKTTKSSSSTALDATIAVFGASGLLAQECIYQALEAGDSVVGLTRNPSKVVIPLGSGGDKAGSPILSDRLTLIQGDATSASDVAKVFSGPSKIDGVIISLGGKTKDVGPTMLADSTQTILTAMEQRSVHGPVKRVAVVSSIGVGDSKGQAPFAFKILMATVMSSIFKDKNAQEKIVRASSAEWCLVRPGGLTVEKPNGIINVIDGQAGTITRADVAQFCLDAAVDPDFEYVHKAPCISSVGGTSWKKDRSDAAREGMK
jgi:uncharacterized protein YbjT (DUF2867 family)